MPKYRVLKDFPHCSMVNAEIVDVRWDNAATPVRIVATFDVADARDRLLEVTFPTNNAIVRILDEMPLSTEDETSVTGLLPEHFAYRVEDALFFKTQSDSWKACGGSIRPVHYRFITGWTCLDVISYVEPELEFVDTEA